MRMSTYEMVKRGLRNRQERHAEGEKEKRGILRGGSSGAFLDDGRMVGKCARLAYLRQQGIEAEGEDLAKGLMFDGGLSNEDAWYNTLVDAGYPKDWILREEECPTSWEVQHAPVTGVDPRTGDSLGYSSSLVTGRPDIVLGQLDEEGNLKPWKGLELKLACSIWTARLVALQGVPDMNHVVQAAHYSWQLGVPFELWYTSRVNYAIGYGKMQSWFPKQGEEGSEFIQYNDDGSAFTLIPFVTGYGLRWRDAEGEEQSRVLQVRRLKETAGMWRDTVLTTLSIENYYRTVAEMPIREEMPPRPSPLTVFGDKASSSQCSYCPLKPVCDKREGDGLKEWTEAVKEWVPLLPSKGSIRD